MSTSSVGRDELQKLFIGLQGILGPVLAGATKDIIEIADFDLSSAASRPFVEFVHWTNTRPDFIARWRVDPVTENREYRRFMALTDDVRAAYAAACYHLERLREIEASVSAALSRYDFTGQIAPNSVAALGRMRRLDFEYHAFILAYRRCLDYLASGLSTYFGQQQTSYHRLPRTLRSAHPKVVAKALIDVYDRHTQKFEFVIGDERGKSLRDRVGHSEFVPAAVINVRSDGYWFVGGGEKLRLADPKDERLLSEILESRTRDLHECISDFLDRFRTVVVEFEAENRTS